MLNGCDIYLSVLLGKIAFLTFFLKIINSIHIIKNIIYIFALYLKRKKTFYYLLFDFRHCFLHKLYSLDRFFMKI
jgi:hypothetical protein